MLNNKNLLSFLLESNTARAAAKKGKKWVVKEEGPVYVALRQVKSSDVRVNERAHPRGRRHVLGAAYLDPGPRRLPLRHSFQARRGTIRYRKDSRLCPDIVRPCTTLTHKLVCVHNSEERERERGGVR